MDSKSQMNPDVPNDPVMKKTVFSNLLEEMMAAAQEIDARRRFDDQVTDFLNAKGLREEFEAWLSAQDSGVKGEAS